MLVYNHYCNRLVRVSQFQLQHQRFHFLSFFRDISFSTINLYHILKQMNVYIIGYKYIILIPKCFFNMSKKWIKIIIYVDFENKLNYLINGIMDKQAKVWVLQQ